MGKTVCLTGNQAVLLMKDLWFIVFVGFLLIFFAFQMGIGKKYFEKSEIDFLIVSCFSLGVKTKLKKDTPFISAFKKEKSLSKV